MRLKLPKSKERLRREAASWLARLQSGREPDVEASFRSWYDADSAHAEAFDRVKRSYESAGLLRHAVRFENGPDRARPSRPVRRFALAAALAVLVPAAIVLSGTGIFSPGRSNRLMYSTAVGEIRLVRLDDGSTVTLDTATDLEVEIGPSKRRASLKKGRARFLVAEAAEPFLIEAGHVTITTSKAMLDVERAGQQSRVELFSGSAAAGTPAVREAAGPVLEQGRGITFVQGEPSATHSVRNPSAWTQGILQFDGTRLVEAVEVANRYSVRRIVLAPGLESLRVTGTFQAGNTAGLAKALSAAFDLRLDSGAEGTLLLSPKPAR